MPLFHPCPAPSNPFWQGLFPAWKESHRTGLSRLLPLRRRCLKYDRQRPFSPRSPVCRHHTKSRPDRESEKEQARNPPRLRACSFSVFRSVFSFSDGWADDSSRLRPARRVTVQNRISRLHGVPDRRFPSTRSHPPGRTGCKVSSPFCRSLRSLRPARLSVSTFRLPVRCCR